MTAQKTAAKMWDEVCGLWARSADEQSRIEFLSTKKSDANASWIVVEFDDRGEAAFTIVRRKSEGGVVVSSLKIWVKKNTIFARPSNATDVVEIWPEEVCGFLKNSVMRRIVQSREELLKKLVAQG